MSNTTPSRKPPIAVRRTLRAEVGFGCPVPVNGAPCGSPYLRWHHFDPEWSAEHHHRPEGMIALCAQHHDEADNGAFTVEHMRAFKANANPNVIRGRFNWMRQNMLAVVGGNFYYDTPVPVQFRDHPVVALTRDAEGYALVNLGMLTASGAPRAHMEENYWTVMGQPSDVECPPSGRVLDVRYSNNDRLSIKFRELPDVAAVYSRYGDEVRAGDWGIEFPVTAVDIQMIVGGTGVRFGPRETNLPGGGVMRNCFAKNCGVGLQFQ